MKKVIDVGPVSCHQVTINGLLEHNHCRIMTTHLITESYVTDGWGVCVVVDMLNRGMT
jgi:hypothetical protein